MSATRYSGSVALRVSCLDNGAMSRPALFKVNASIAGVHVGSTTVSGLNPEDRCTDNPLLIDEIACSALAFLLDDDAIDSSDVAHTDNGFHVQRKRAQ